MKVLTLRTDWGAPEKRKRLNSYGGVGYYRSIKPTEQISKKYDVTNWGNEAMHLGDTAEEQWTKVFTDFDVVWTTHLFNKMALGWMLFAASHFKKKLIIDIDDDFLHVEKSHYLYERFKPKAEDRTVLSTALSLCDAVTVSTAPLKDMIRQHIWETHGIVKPIYIIPNMNDAKDWPTKRAKKTEEIVIGYSGSMSHNADFAMVAPQIRRILEKHPNVIFKVLGTVASHEVPELFKGWGNLLERVMLFGGTDTFREYPEWFADQHWDIGIAPLVDCSFNEKKSHIKWMEYAMHSVPTLASRRYPYFMQHEGRDTIVDGKTGLLADTPREFGDKLDQLVQSEQLRTEIGAQANEYVTKNWQYEDGPILDRFDRMLKEIR